jgi:uncharacterized protein YkwD
VRLIGRLMAIGIVVTVLAVWPAVVLAAGGGAPAPQSLSLDEERAVALVNADRAAQGLPPLRVNMTLVVLARDYAQDMINRNFWGHKSPEGEEFTDRMVRYGVKFLSAGENVARNTSVDAAHRALMNSDGHRANILHKAFTEVGIGVRYGDAGEVYVVQEFVGH